MSLKNKKEIDKKLVWHPFTQAKDYENMDIPIIIKAKGLKVYDSDKRFYYDTVSSWWTNSIGHRNRNLLKAIKRQIKKLDHIIFAGFTHLPAINLCEKLSKLLPDNLTKFFFSDDGSTSVEVAIKIAYQYWKNIGINKDVFVHFTDSYHGDTIGSVSIGGIDLYHQTFKDLTFKTVKIKSPDCSNCNFRKSVFTYDTSELGCNIECFQEVEKTIMELKDRVVGIFIEPLLQGVAGMKVYPKEFLQKLGRLAKDIETLLIFDEVATGFGRTGCMFAFEKAYVVPDIICLSKALGGGIFPLALTVTSEKIYKAFYGDYNKTLFHGHSYTAYPIACEVANAHIDYLLDKKLPYSNKDSFDYFHLRLKELQDFDFVNDIRFIGSIGAIDIVKSRKNKIIYEPNERIGFKVYKESLKNNLILRPLGNTIYWFLPINTKIKDIKKIMDLSVKTLKDAIG